MCIRDSFKSVRDVSGAQSRLRNAIDGATRDVITSHDLREAVRSSARELQFSDLFVEIVGERTSIGVDIGRAKLNGFVEEIAAKELKTIGIELLDFRIKRINYVKEVQEQVFERMKSERLRIAQKYRSEGKGKAQEIKGESEKKMKEVLSDSYRKAEELRGNADAEAAGIYADALGKNPELYELMTSLKIWKESLDGDTTLIMSTASQIFRRLSGMTAN